MTPPTTTTIIVGGHVYGIINGDPKYENVVIGTFLTKYNQLFHHLVSVRRGIIVVVVVVVGLRCLTMKGTQTSRLLQCTKIISIPCT